jgi:hypothetical protein
MPTYNPLIPTGFVDLDQDYQNIQDNFNQANVVMGVNHYPFDNTTGNKGKHFQVSMPIQAAAPVPGSAEVILYSKAGYGGSSELFMVRDTDPLTEVNLTTAKIAAPLAAQNGVSWLPGGILFEWGYDTVTAGSTNIIALPVSFPNNLFNIQLTINANTNDLRDVYVITLPAAGVFANFTVRGAAQIGTPAILFFWTAIGN